MTSEREAYVYIQLPGSLETVPAALLRVQTLPEDTRTGCCHSIQMTKANSRTDPTAPAIVERRLAAGRSVRPRHCAPAAITTAPADRAPIGPQVT